MNVEGLRWGIEEILDECRPSLWAAAGDISIIYIRSYPEGWEVGLFVQNTSRELERKIGQRIKTRFPEVKSVVFQLDNPENGSELALV